MKPHCQVGRHPRCLPRSHFGARSVVVSRSERLSEDQAWRSAACGTATNPFGLLLQPHLWVTLINLLSEGRQKCCRGGMGFWKGLKSGGSMGCSAGGSLGARYRPCWAWPAMGPIWQISCSRRGAGGAPGLGEAKALGFCQAGTGEFSSCRALPAGCRGGGNVGRAGREMLWIGSKAAPVLITKDRFMLSVKYQGGHENYEYY